ncbi:hypothetical protein J4423_01490 [Candidatus Pacearchaeota archaeon]|nr:hypothetical protein [Candidatus Pacearchaeota archaeon]
MKRLILSVCFFIAISFTMVSAQIVRDDTFVPVSSAFVGSHDAGCGLACMTSMIASLNDSEIGTNVLEIYQGLEAELPLHPHPFTTYELTNAVLNFLLSFI